MKIIEKKLIFPVESRVTESCHASSICMTGSGALLCAWFGGTAEKAPDVEIYLSRSEDGGESWSRPEQVTRTEDVACWNPVLFCSGGETSLFFRRGKEIPEWRTYVMRSRDGGRSWSGEEELVPGDASGGRGPVKNKPVLLSNGVLLAGSSHETAGRCWRAFADISADGGRTWTRGEYVNDGDDVKLIQPAVWEDGDGVHMLMRSVNGCVYRSDSGLARLEFCRAYPIDVPNNNSGIDAAVLPDGRVCLVCNPVTEERGRSPVSLLVSEDGGKSFRKEFDLHDEAGCEFSYPAVIYAGGELYITFTYKRRSVMFVRVGV